MRASSIRGLARMAGYRWQKRFGAVNRRRRGYRSHIKRAAHRADRQAARVELHGYVDERYEVDEADDCEWLGW